MMRNRGSITDPITPLAYQSQAKFLLYDDSRWAGIHANQAIDTIAGLIENPETRESWFLLNRGNALESRTLSAAYWIAEHGPSHGIRTPNVRERARALGMGDYMAQLHLTDLELFNAQGNIFDLDSLCEALYYALFTWLNGSQDIPRHVYRA